MAPSTRSPARLLLTQPGFLAFEVSRLLSGTALTLLRAAVAWQVYEISGSAFHLGLLGLAQFAPALVLSLIGGAAADAYDRKRLVMVFQVVPTLCSAALAIVSLAGQPRLGVLYAAVMTVAAAAAFESPARSALLPQLVERRLFPTAVGLHSAIQMGAFVTGPVLMGFAVDIGGIALPYALHAAFMIAGLVAMARVRPLQQATPRGRVHWQAVVEGLRYVRRQPIVLGCMTLDMFAVLFAGATALLPIYATDILEVGPRGYGLLAAALEIGAVLAAIALLALPPVRRTGLALLWAVVGFAVSTIVFGLSRFYPLSLLAYMVAGMSDYLSVVMRGTAIQLSTPDELRGRVSAVNLIFIGASNQLGAAESGFLAAATSPTFSVVSGGVGALVVAGLVAWRNPALRHYRAHDAEPAADG
ncbi:MAG TPA: MFS transporter [Thermoanaerobaculia bacterium]|nr:MFS transporter [Thermoanaerobaculia bacterium]